MIAPDQGLAAIVEGAGNSFSSTAAQTIAQTILLNALVEKGDIRSCPSRSVESRTRKGPPPNT